MATTILNKTERVYEGWPPQKKISKNCSFPIRIIIGNVDMSFKKNRSSIIKVMNYPDK